MNKEDRCRWYIIAMKYPHEGYEKCKTICDGYDTRCGCYISNQEVQDSLDKMVDEK